MTTTPKISLVMPVYNAEKHLRQALDSILAQTMGEFELICINDGSTDKSREILDQYANKDARIRLHDQANAGPAKARNLGLAQATGDYIWFVDADDWIEPQACQEIYATMSLTKVEALFFCAKVYNEKKKSFITYPWYENFGNKINDSYLYKVNSFDAYKTFILRLNGTLWNKVFEKDFLKKHAIKLNDDLFINDDALFLIHTTLRRPTILFLEKKYYNYRQDFSDNIIGVAQKSNPKIFCIIEYAKVLFQLAETTDDPLFRDEILFKAYEALNHWFTRCHKDNKSLYIKKARKLLAVYNPKFSSSNKSYSEEYETATYLFSNKFLKRMHLKTPSMRFKTVKLHKLSIYKTQESTNKSFIKILGLNIYSNKLTNGIRRKKLLGVPYHTDKPLNITQSYDQKSTLAYLSDLQRCQALHSQVFPKFKNAHAGKDVVIVGTGPTLNFYSPLPNAIHIGLNRAFTHPGVQLDYLFIQDYLATKGYIHKAKDYPCIKFYGLPALNISEMVIPESLALQHGALRYYTNFQWRNLSHVKEGIGTYDLSSEFICDWVSVVFSALQFALYTNPKRIYLVGCDTSHAGHYDNTIPELKLDIDKVKSGYLRIKKFLQTFYPETEIISINPVGLKCMFKDVYTHSYIEQNSDLKNLKLDVL